MKSPKYLEVAKSYRAVRPSHISQARLAELAGVTRRTILRIENGQHRPTPRVRDRIAKALGVPPSELPAYERVEPPFASSESD